MKFPISVPTLFATILLASPTACGRAADASEPASQEEKPAADKAPTMESESAGSNALLDPDQLKETAPDTFRAKFETTKGDFVLEVTREWAPQGADRFYNLVKNGFFDDVRFFRCIEGFMVQFGINGNPKVSSAWQRARIPDDKPKQSNGKGMITFATSGPNSRTTQVFINFKDNSFLDSQGFAPFGKVVEGMEVVDSLYKGYGEGAPRGRGPSQGRIQSEGNAYLDADFPKLDGVKKATIVEG